MSGTRTTLLDSSRREAIIRLLETRDDNLPQPVRRDHSTSGFTHKPSPRSCPDCLANGRPMVGCETCGGSGVVSPPRLDRIAAPDARTDDGDPRDPYADNSGPVLPYGWTPEGRDREVALDNAIQNATRVLNGMLRPATTADELDRANREPYVWERERRQMYRRFDYHALDLALDELHRHDPQACAIVHTVYIYKQTHQPSMTVEAVLERGLRFIDERMPDPISAPGHEQKHPALQRRDARPAA